MVAVQRRLRRVMRNYCVLSAKLASTDTACAGVPLSHYPSLSTSNSFVCLVCTNKVNELARKELRAEIDALKTEVQALRQALNDSQDRHESEMKPVVDELAELRASIQKSNDQSIPRVQQRTFSDVVSESRSLPAKTNYRPSRRERTARTPRSPREPATTGKVIVQGARRVWGTMKSCTSAAISGAISKLTTVSANLRVKRKFRTLHDNKSAWWFVIHGQESELSSLQLQWEKVQMQTGWSLQPCYMPKAKNTDAAVAHIPSHDSQQLNPTSDNPATGPQPQNSTHPTINTSSNEYIGEEHVDLESNSQSVPTTSTSFLDLTHPSPPCQ